jgi:hypothetical protein
MLGVSPHVVARDRVVRRSRVGPDPVTAVSSALVAPDPVGVAVRETDPVERAVADSVVGDEDSSRPRSGQEDAGGEEADEDLNSISLPSAVVKRTTG